MNQTYLSFSFSSAVYSYGPLGQRIQKTEGGVTTVYLNRGVNVLYEKQTVGGSASNDYVYANGLLIAKLSSSSTNYFVTDILGSVRLVTDSGGTTGNFSSNYAPFGQQYGASGTDPGYKYTGKPQDSLSGLYYYGARYYDVSIGRFITRDPGDQSISDPQGLNPYPYVDNSPIDRTDPTGLIGFAVLNLFGNSSCPSDILQHLWCSFTNPEAVMAQTSYLPGGAGLGVKLTITGVMALDIALTGSKMLGSSSPTGIGNPVTPKSRDDYSDPLDRFAGGKPNEQPRYPAEDNRHPRTRPATNDSNPTIRKAIVCGAGVVGAIAFYIGVGTEAEKQNLQYAQDAGAVSIAAAACYVANRYM